MSLLYNPDWEKAKTSFVGWWEGANTSSPLLQILAPRNRPIEEAPKPETPDSVEDQWLNAEFRMDLFEYNASRTFYGGDAVPFFDPQIGPGAMALYLGSPPKFMPDTVWYGKVHDDIRTAPLPEFDETNKYWQWSLRIAREAVSRFRGKALVSFPDFVEGVDALACLFGSEELLTYMVDCPAHVHRFMERHTDLYFDYYDRLYEIVKDDDGASCYSAFYAWGPGKTAKLQCDFSAMISPQMFREFVQPYLREQCRRLDYSVYHWDGPSAIPHLDALLEIEELHAIQWTPGAGQKGVGDQVWWTLYSRIVEAGKSLMLLGVSVDEIQPLVDRFGPERLDIMTQCDSEEEASDVVERFQ